MRRRIISTLILISIGVLLVGCKPADESNNNLNENGEANKVEVTKELTEEEKTIIEAQRLCDTGSYEDTMNYIETVIYPNGSKYSEEQQKQINQILAKISENYVPPKVALTKEEAVSTVLNCDDVVNYDYGNNCNKVYDNTESYVLGDKQGYRIEIKADYDSHAAKVGVYFVDSSNGDIYKSKDDRFELLE